MALPFLVSPLSRRATPIKGSLRKTIFKGPLRVRVARKFFCSGAAAAPLTGPGPQARVAVGKEKQMHITQVVTVFEKLAAQLQSGSVACALIEIEAQLIEARRTETDYEAWVELNMHEMQMAEITEPEGVPW